MIRPWTEIRAFYQDLVDRGFSLQGMVRLVEQIEKSHYAQGIHGATSVHDLRIVQFAKDIRPDDAYLRVSPRFDGTIEFRYVDTYIKDKQWFRVVNDDDAFARLVGFLGQLHWFSGNAEETE